MKRDVRFGVFVLAVMAVVPTAFATPARVQSLNGLPLFEDDTDLFTFPALAAPYGRSVQLHVGAGGPLAGFLHGRKGGWQLGAFHNSTVAYNDLANTASNVGVALLQPSPILSFFAANPTSENTAWGFAINTAFGLQRAVPQGGTLQYQLSFDLEAILGYSAYFGNRHSDSAIAISYHRYMRREMPNLVADTPVIPSFALRHRTIWLGDDGVDFGIYAEAARRDEQYKQNLPLPSVATLARYFVMAGLGPRFRVNKWAMISPTAELVVSTVGGSVDTSGVGLTTVTFPRLRGAVEISPLEWLFIRAGVSKSFSIVLARPQTGGQADQTGAGFGWSTGLGVRKGGVEVDATVSNAFLLNGPSFIGGGAPGLFGSLSARFHY
jgi:hypothetical protein